MLRLVSMLMSSIHRFSMSSGPGVCLAFSKTICERSGTANTRYAYRVSRGSTRCTNPNHPCFQAFLYYKSGVAAMPKVLYICVIIRRWSIASVPGKLPTLS